MTESQNNSDAGGVKSLDENIDRSKRDFLMVSSSVMGAIGAAAVAWPFIDSLNPAADTLAMSVIEVDLSAIGEGQQVKVMWQGQPIFIRHRTAQDIKYARDDDGKNMPDPQNDAERVKEGKEKWLVLVGVCTHLGCVPLADKGDFHGWFCPCHGSHYDASGRIRRGPAPTNLPVPPYEFVEENLIKIG